MIDERYCAARDGYQPSEFCGRALLPGLFWSGFGLADPAPPPWGGARNVRSRRL